ncbi:MULTISPECIES: DUF4431 domain-containing protein [unclassified Serratia (in: enterobacteria)]|uniref:DUF4431 domain-containing protein n=1 Tax=unclassified Serratia (in: enterobacteria) TaxID=2647522 RepID=UPI00068BB559|nr:MULTISPECIES: DUF4431 domain-containing protein [unclassified Serratia (in: enterobacteria)]
MIPKNKRFACLHQWVAVPLTLFALHASAVSAVKGCLNYDKPLNLSGIVEIRVFFGSPNFGENPETDKRDIQGVLFLDKPICTLGGDFNEAEKDQIEVTLIPTGSINLSSFAGQHVTASGNLSHAHTGHHNTALLLELSGVPTPYINDNTPEPVKTERKPILDAIRPVAASKAGQEVRIKVDRLNVSNEWAVLVGQLLATDGGDLNWRLAKDCEADLDKMLWVVLNKSSSQWHVKVMDICSPEPPYWYLEDKDLTMPCEVYAGLNNGEKDLEERCRILRNKPY